VYGICTAPIGQTLVSTPSATNSVTVKSATAPCGPLVPTGGGFNTAQGAPFNAIVSNDLDPTGPGVLTAAVERVPYAPNWTVISRAICA
ncbi:MAG: hypothetical protein ACRCYU_11190, partial [Nocardioides sp.]